MLTRALHLQSTPYADTRDPPPINPVCSHQLHPNVHSLSSKVRAWLAVGCGDDAADMAVVLRHHHRLNNGQVEGCALASSQAFDSRNPTQRCHGCDPWPHILPTHYSRYLGQHTVCPSPPAAACASCQTVAETAVCHKMKCLNLTGGLVVLDVHL
jgi:hypothetical protein